MRAQLDDRTVDDLVAGRVPQGRADLDGLATLLAQLRTVAHDCAPRPDAALARVFADGLPADLPAEKPAPAPAARRRTPPARRPSWRRAPALSGAMLAGAVGKLAALGLGAKAALALTTAAALSAGAVAADLPERIGSAWERRADHSPASPPDIGGRSDDPGLPAPSPAVPAGGGEGDGQGTTDPQAPQAPTVEEVREDRAGDGLDRARDETAGTPARIPAEPGGGAAPGRRPEERGRPPATTPPGGPRRARQRSAPRRRGPPQPRLRAPVRMRPALPSRLGQPDRCPGRLPLRPRPDGLGAIPPGRGSTHPPEVARARPAARSPTHRPPRRHRRLLAGGGHRQPPRSTGWWGGLPDRERIPGRRFLHGAYRPSRRLLRYSRGAREGTHCRRPGRASVAARRPDRRRPAR